MNQPGDQTANHQPAWIGRLLILVAAILWSTSGLFAKAPVFDNWPLESRGIILAFWRALFASLALIWFVRRVEWSIKLLPMLLTFAAMNWFYLSALVSTEASIAVWLMYTAPAWVFLVSVFWLKETVTTSDVRMMIFAVLGVAIILIFQSQLGSGRGLVFGLVSGLTFAGVVISLRQLRDFDPAWLIFLNHAATSILFLPLVIGQGLMPAGNQWLYLAGFGILQMGVPYVLFARGLQSVRSHEASGITLVEPILVPVWVFAVWSSSPDYQPPTIATVVGGSFILAGLCIRYAGQRRRQTNQDPANAINSDDN